MDWILWIIAVLLFLISAIHWVLMPLAISWAAWIGFILGSIPAAVVSDGRLSVILVSGFAIAWVARKAHGLWLAKQNGLL